MHKQVWQAWRPCKQPAAGTAAAGLAGELQVLPQWPKLLQSTIKHRKAVQWIDQSDTA